MTVFPENMERTSSADPSAAVSLIDRYIRYMRERIEFAVGHIAKKTDELQTAVSKLGKGATRILSAAPDSSTVGIVGQMAVDEVAGTAYICVGANDGTYTWKEIT